MGILVERIYFDGSLPTASELVTALCHHTGEDVRFEEETEILSCVATGDAIGFMALADEPSEWMLRNLNLTGGYLWSASTAVLLLLGGKREWPLPGSPTLPAWAYKPWHLAKREYKKRKGPWLTHEEAHRQGLELR